MAESCKTCGQQKVDLRHCDFCGAPVCDSLVCDTYTR